MRKPIAISIYALLTLNIHGQKQTFKEQALEEFKKEHYNEAIQILEQAAEQTPEDAEIFYYLGWFKHYRAEKADGLKFVS